MEVVEFMNGSAEVNQLELCVDRLMRTIEQLTEDNKQNISPMVPIRWE